MKNSIITAIICALTISTLLTSCSKEDENNPTTTASDIIGNYALLISPDSCASGNNSAILQIQITHALQNNQVVFSKVLWAEYMHTYFDVTVTISGNNFDFSYQSDNSPPLISDMKVTGNGIISSDKQKITINYTVDYPYDSLLADLSEISCTSIYTRK